MKKSALRINRANNQNHTVEYSGHYTMDGKYDDTHTTPENAITGSIQSDDVENEQEKSGDYFDRLLDKFIAVEDSSTTKDETERHTQKWANTVSLEMQKLKNMVGLERLKAEINDARIMAMFNKERNALSLGSQTDNRHHMIFTGNPGTGKTTVARLVGKIYHKMGLLSRGHTVETERAKLVGEFIGQTEKNTKEAIEKARGGVLFIDEAYTLLKTSKESNDFGKEVINALLTVLAEPEPNMIVILAGYEDQMNKLLNHNPGLKERFPMVFHFDDYTATELMEIAIGICIDGDYELTDKAYTRLCRLMEKAVEQRDENFGNGRWVHNLIHHGVIKSMARRVMASPHSSTDRQLFRLIEESDVAEAERVFIKRNETKIKPIRIGFTA